MWQSLVLENYPFLVYSSKLGGLQQWFNCFEILFDVSSVSLMQEYWNLEAMIDIKEGEEKDFWMMHESQGCKIGTLFPVRCELKRTIDFKFRNTKAMRFEYIL